MINMINELMGHEGCGRAVGHYGAPIGRIYGSTGPEMLIQRSRCMRSDYKSHWRSPSG